MNRKEIIERTKEFVKKELSNCESGHNWWHAYRVWKNTILIAKSENVDRFIIELGALLHDISEPKFHNGDEQIGPRKARKFLSSLGVEESVISHVENIILNISFKGGNCKQNFKSLELDVVQDADRLDAIGAIGIARTFNYGGFKNREIFNPEIKAKSNMTKEEYRNNTGHTINHFYEKLLLLKDLMNTETAREIAVKRHQFMEIYLKEFYQEWEGKA